MNFYERIASTFRLRHTYDNQVSQQRAVSLLYIALLTSVFALFVTFIFQPLFITLSLTRLVIGLIVALIYPVVLTLLNRGLLYQAATIFVGITIFAVTVLIPAGTDYDISPFSGAALIVPILLSGLLLGRNEIIITAVIISVYTLSVGIGLADPGLGMTDDFFIMLLVTFLNILIAGYMIIYSANLNQLGRNYNKQIRQVVSLSSGTLAMDASWGRTRIASEVTQVLTNQLDYTYAHIYWNENIRNVQVDYLLQAANTRRIVQVSIDDNAYLLDGITEGLAIPIVSNNELLGILDIQSSESGRFGESDISLITGYIARFSDQIYYRQRIESLRHDVREQATVIEQQRQRIDNYETRYQQRSQDMWGQYLDRRGARTVGFDLEGNEIQPAQNSDSEVDRLLSDGAVYQDGIEVIQRQDHQVIRVPIIMGQDVLGAMAFALPSRRILTQRQRNMLESIMQRLSLALENKRLLEQSQSLVEREQSAQKVGDTLLSASSIESVLRLAAEQFNEALGAIQTQVYLNDPTYRPSRGNTGPLNTMQKVSTGPLLRTGDTSPLTSLPDGRIPVVPDLTSADNDGRASSLRKSDMEIADELA